MMPSVRVSSLIIKQKERNGSVNERSECNEARFFAFIIKRHKEPK